jgi:cytochrome c biogenesis protein
MKSSRTTSAKLTDFLGSMNLAITLLVVLAIASVIGTVLQQNQPYTSYEIKFGKFWFETFRTLGLFDVYSAVWFLLILAFLVISTTTCVVRNTPGMLRELTRFREQARKKSLLSMKNSQNLHSQESVGDIRELAIKFFKAESFRFREHKTEKHTVLAAMKGGANKWGYWLTHLGIIVICLGGLLDSRLPLMLAEWQGTVKPETRNVPASEVPAISTLPTSNFSYRGSVDVPEGRRANIIFLPVRDGYLVQKLPFEVEVKEFRVEHYSTGQPKSFESDIVIHDSDLEQPLETTISVNHPLIYKGAAIYQASFGDGGSEINMTLHPFVSNYATQEMSGNVFKQYDLTNNERKFRLELDDFRLFNINPIKNDLGEEEQKNLGPSFTFRLRNAAGEAIEYTNYMVPVELDGRRYLLSGVKTSPSEPQRFLHIPADQKGSAGLFMQYLKNLQDDELVQRIALETTQSSMRGAQLDDNNVQNQVVQSMVRLTELFVTTGFDGIAEDIASRFPEDQREAVSEAFLKVLQASLRAVYIETLQQNGRSEPDEQDWLFYDDSMNAIANLPFYGSPWYIQMTSFKQIEASGLQITRSPGKNVVYFGSAMLIIGVFLLFYVSHRRIWLYLQPLEDGQTEIVLAGSANRNQDEFNKYFQRLQEGFRQALSVRGN